MLNKHPAVYTFSEAASAENLENLNERGDETLGRKIKSSSDAAAKVNEDYSATAECLQELQSSLGNVERLGIPDAGDGLRDSVAKVRANQKKNREKYEAIAKEIEEQSVTRQGYQDRLKDLEKDLPMVVKRAANLQEQMKDGELVLAIATIEVSGIKHLADKVPRVVEKIRQIVEQGTETK
ncbi:hypothetical protein NW762_007470 [Fusarium torreyae]|uniref:Uncharacterized protein n=1 Tax=Fusarium torreyae TaxID=1237075 RepID=A0A9W8RX40_9HYPO|nr:hypothetical protein NW762_007470 [Fusarium torreyae]